MKKPLIAICGPTASGKTALSIELAKIFNSEIVSADSMQIYKRMDIGTAKPSGDEMCGITHYMIDIVEPYENYSVGKYVEDAKSAVEKVIAKGKVPILVGGTGFYIDSLLTATKFGGIEFDSKLRDELNIQAQQIGGAQMRKKLAQFDPERAQKLHDNDLKRIVRAIEIYELTGKTIGYWEEKSRLEESPYNAIYFALSTKNRDILYDRIEKRVDKMVDDGLFDEVKGLIDEQIPKSCTAMQAIGYRESVMALEGKISNGDAIEQIKINSRHYAKRQLTWFRRNSDINWFNTDEYDFKEIIKKCNKMVENYF